MLTSTLYKPETYKVWEMFNGLDLDIKEEFCKLLKASEWFSKSETAEKASTTSANDETEFWSKYSGIWADVDDDDPLLEMLERKGN